MQPMRPLLQFNRKRQLQAAVCSCLITVFCRLGIAQSQISWTSLGPAAVRDRVIALASDVRNGVIYLAAPGGGLWQSSDGGQTWTALLDLAPSLQVCSVAIDPSAPDVVYVGSGDEQNPRPQQGVARSTDDGRTWTYLARFTNQPVCTLTVDPSNSARLFAGSSEGLFISTDTGATWKRVITTPVTSVSIDGQNIYAGTLGANAAGQRDKNLSYSSDGGKTWSSLALPSNPNAPSAVPVWIGVAQNSGAITVVVAYPDPSTTAAGTPLVLDSVSSADQGTTWTSVFNFGKGYAPLQLLSTSNGTLYVAGANLYTSRDRGVSWQVLHTAEANFHTMTFSNGTLIVGGENGVDAVALTSVTVPPVLTQLPIGRFLRATFDGQGGTWAAGPAGLFPLSGANSTPAGTPVSGIPSTGNVAAQTSGASIIASGSANSYRSIDGGAHFTPRSVIPATESHAPFPPLLLDPAVSTSAYMAGQHLYHTSDGGLSWITLPTVDPDLTRVVVALAIAPSSRLVLYAATACLPEVAGLSCPESSNIWRSTNGGQSWTQLNPVSGFVTRLAVDPRQATTLYAAIGGFPGGPSLTAGEVAGDLLCLGLCAGQTTGSSNWISIRGNLPKTPINAVIIDPTSVATTFFQPAPRLFVATDSGVFVTFNAGTAWTDISTGSDPHHSLPNTPMTDVFLRPSDGSLLVASFGRGMYSISTAGLTAGISANPLSLGLTLMHGASLNTGLTLSNGSSTTAASWFMIPLDPWITLSTTTGTLIPGGAVQLPIHISATNLASGTYKGRLQLISGGYTQTVSFDLHVTALPAAISIVSGNNVAAGPGASVPLQVLVSDADQNPLGGVSVSFAVTSGAGSLSTRLATSNAAGIAGTVLTLPAAGTVQVVASAGNLSTTFTDTAAGAPLLTPSSVLDGVTFNPYTSPSPGAILAISGQSLAATKALAPASTPLPTIIQSTRVLITTSNGDTALPLFSISPTSVQALLPANFQPGTYTLRVESNGVASNRIPITVASFDPGIFTLNNSGKGRGIFFKSDGSLVSASNPADRGSTISFYAAGLGAVNAQNRTVRTPQVYFDSFPATDVSSGLATIAGRYVVTVRVPPQLTPANNVSVSLTIGGFASNRVTVAIR